MQKKILYKFLILTICFTCSASSVEIINGTPKIIDGDTIIIEQYKIRLHGIDAPEKKQICKKIYLNIGFLNFSKKYHCGKVATNKLKKKINYKNLKCELKKNKDFYNRYLGTCFLNKININSWMVRNGYAVAYKRYSKKYIQDEKYAKKNKLGLWSGSFEIPEKWRKNN